MPIGVIINALSVVVGGIIGALVGNKLHADFKRCGNVPRTVVLMAVVRPHFEFQVFNVVHARKDYGMEGWTCIPVQIFVAQKSKEFYERIMVSRLVNLVDNYDNRTGAGLYEF